MDPQALRRYYLAGRILVKDKKIPEANLPLTLILN
jgi:hypothetical protein